MTAGSRRPASRPSTAPTQRLKWIIHDWSDTEAVRILSTCRRAMSPGSRLLLVERVIPPGNEPHPSKISDFAMLVLLGGQERTGEQYLSLLDKAGFRRVSVIPSVSTFSIIEAS